MAVSSFFETLMNGHKPRTFTSTMLFTNAAPIRIRK
jgi:hypothetical protein